MPLRRQSSIALCWAILFSGLPLWIANDTTAPLWTAAVAVVISSIAIALSRSGLPATAAHIQRSPRHPNLGWRACALLRHLRAGRLADLPILSLAVIVLGVGVHVVSELYYVSARWGLSLGLIAHDAQSQYQGVAASTEATAVALGPAIVTTLVTGLHGAGWIILGTLLIAAAAPTAALTRKATRTGNRNVTLAR